MAGIQRKHRRLVAAGVVFTAGAVLVCAAARGAPASDSSPPASRSAAPRAGAVTPGAIERPLAVLRAYAADPRAVSHLDLDTLLALRREELDALIASHPGFALWLRWGSSAFAFRRRRDYGWAEYLILDLHDGRVVDVLAARAYMVTRAPRPDDWFRTLLIALLVGRDRALSRYLGDTGADTWDFARLAALLGEPPPRVLAGSDGPVPVVGIESFRGRFPRLYRGWIARAGEAAPPDPLPAMIERARTFDASRIEGMAAARLPAGLRPVVVRILDALVARAPQRVATALDPRLGRRALGRLAASVLHPRLRVERVHTGSNASPRVADVTLTSDVSPETGPRVESVLHFRRGPRGWVLTRISHGRGADNNAIHDAGSARVQLKTTLPDSATAGREALIATRRGPP